MACLFCKFSSGRAKKHRNGYPLIVLCETKHAFSFLAIDFIAHEDGHLLVTTKRHFRNFEQLPEKVLHDVAALVSAAVKVTRKRHAGCNVLLNDGRVAGQQEPHVHFHVIPRDRGDGIGTELWKRKKMGLKKFVRLSNRIKKSFLLVK